MFRIARPASVAAERVASRLFLLDQRVVVRLVVEIEEQRRIPLCGTLWLMTAVLVRLRLPVTRMRQGDLTEIGHGVLLL